MILQQQPDYTAIHRMLPRSGDAIRRYILAFFEEMRIEVRKNLRAAEIKIHFSFDMWSGLNRHAYQAIVAHWLDSETCLHTALLSIHRFCGAHTGVNQAEHFWTTINDYEIQHLIGKFNIDNASNNDTALQEISRCLTLGGYPTIYPVTECLRCFGHVLNLAFKAFLWGSNVEAFEVALDAIGDEVAELQHWRQKGPLGKLHNVLDYIRKTPQRLDRFEGMVRSMLPEETVHRVKLGNITCWSSDYEAIQRSFRLREPIEEFIRQAIRLNQNGERDVSEQALIHDELLPEDWELLRSVKDILEPFKEWTNRLQVRYANGCVADILPTMDELLSSLEDAKAFYTAEGNSAHLVAMINNGWDILNKYVYITVSAT